MKEYSVQSHICQASFFIKSFETLLAHRAHAALWIGFDKFFKNIQRRLEKEAKITIHLHPFEKLISQCHSHFQMVRWICLGSTPPPPPPHTPTHLVTFISSRSREASFSLHSLQETRTNELRKSKCFFSLQPWKRLKLKGWWL